MANGRKQSPYVLATDQPSATPSPLQREHNPPPLGQRISEHYRLDEPLLPPITPPLPFKPLQEPYQFLLRPQTLRPPPHLSRKRILASPRRHRDINNNPIPVHDLRSVVVNSKTPIRIRLPHPGRGRGSGFGNAVNGGGEEFPEEEDDVVVGAALGGVIVGEEAGRAAAAGAGCGGRVGGAAGEAEAGVGLLAAAGGLVEDGAVDFGVDDVVGAAEVERGVGAEGEGGEFGLGEEAEIDDWEGGELEEVVGRGIDGRRRHHGGEPNEMRRRNTKSVL